MSDEKNFGPPEWRDLTTPAMNERIERQDRGEEKPPSRSGVYDLFHRMFDPNYHWPLRRKK